MLNLLIVHVIIELNKNSLYFIYMYTIKHKLKHETNIFIDNKRHVYYEQMVVTRG